MSNVIIYNETDEQRRMVSALNTAAEEWDAIAVEADTVTETPSTEREAWQGTYRPRGAHAAKMDKLQEGTDSLAAAARAVAAALRDAATDVTGNATAVDENNAEAVEQFNEVDTDLGGGYTI